MKSICVFTSLCVMFFCSESALLLQDNFTTFDNWQLDIEGSTASVTRPVRVVHNDSRSVLSTRIAYCGEGERCYRAEIATAINQRELVFKIPGEFWIGFSMRIPEDWKDLGRRKGTYDVTYFMQVHGGDNLGRSPNLGFRNTGKDLTVNICGNDKPYSPEELCVYESVGSTPSPGEWVSWVVHVKFTSVKRDGFIHIWKDNKLKLSKKKLLTGYLDNREPYLKLGAYQWNWKMRVPTLTQWVGFEYSEVRIGNEASNYSEVYTGPVDVTTDNNSGSRNSRSTWISSFSDLQIVLGVLSSFWVLCLLYWCCWRRPSLHTTVQRAGTHRPEKPMGTSSSLSLPYFSRPNRGKGGLGKDGNGGITMPSMNRRSGKSRSDATGSWAKLRDAARGTDDDNSDTPSELAARAALEHLTRLNTRRNSRLSDTSPSNTGRSQLEEQSKNPIDEVAALFSHHSSSRSASAKNKTTGRTVGGGRGTVSSQEALRRRMSSLASGSSKPIFLAKSPPTPREFQLPSNILQPAQQPILRDRAFGSSSGLQGWTEVKSVRPSRSHIAVPSQTPPPPPPPVRPRRSARVALPEQGVAYSPLVSSPDVPPYHHTERSPLSPPVPSNHAAIAVAGQRGVYRSSRTGGENVAFVQRELTGQGTVSPALKPMETGGHSNDVIATIGKDQQGASRRSAQFSLARDSDNVILPCVLSALPGTLPTSQSVRKSQMGEYRGMVPRTADIEYVNHDWLKKKGYTIRFPTGSIRRDPPRRKNGSHSTGMSGRRRTTLGPTTISGTIERRRSSSDSSSSTADSVYMEQLEMPHSILLGADDNLINQSRGKNPMRHKIVHK